MSVALRDTAEHLVEAILADHKINETTNVSMWKVQWDETEEQATWEPHSTVKDIEKFHLYCFAQQYQQ